MLTGSCHNNPKSMFGSARISVLVCPHCTGSNPEAMPVDYCLILYQCASCGAYLRPLPGDCCVFCSFGSTKCPSMKTSSGRMADLVCPRPACRTRFALPAGLDGFVSGHCPECGGIVAGHVETAA